jgi:DNA-binding NtrC family response regulator
MIEKILVVDDDDFVLDCFQRVLAQHFKLDTAPGPWEALHAISTRGPYAVIVSDMRMPAMNGIQFLTKAKEVAPESMGILLSGNLDPVEMNDIPAELVFKILEKPLPFAELIAIVNEALEHYRNLKKERCI